MECPHQNVVKELSELSNLDYSVGTTCPSGILLEQCRLIFWTNTDNEEEEESYTKLIDIMFSDIQLDHKLQYEQREIIDIN